jgi:hypothetical protein
MEHNYDTHRRLADYIYNDLNPEELVEFETELSNDPQLAEYYDLNTQVKEYLQAKIQLEEMRSDPMLEDAEKLADLAFEKESGGPESRQPIDIGRKSSRVRQLSIATAIAASMAILIAIGMRSGISPERIYDRYYVALDASDFSQRGESNEAYRDLAQGINSYREGNYSQSIEQFARLVPDPVYQTEVQFFSALSHMGLEQFESAQRLFETLISNDSRYHLETLWYLSLCCLNTGEFEQADQYLGQLENFEGMYQKDAQSLRKKLRRLK